MCVDGKFVQRDMSKAMQYLQLASHGGESISDNITAIWLSVSKSIND